MVGNRFIKLAVNKYPERLIGFAWIDPNDKVAISEMRTAILDWKFKGIKLHMDMAPASIDKLKEVFMEAERLSIPVCIHLDEDFDFMDDLCKEYLIIYYNSSPRHWGLSFRYKSLEEGFSAIRKV